MKSEESNCIKYPLCITLQIKEKASNSFPTQETTPATSQNQSTEIRTTDTSSDIYEYAKQLGKSIIEKRTQKEEETQSPLSPTFITSIATLKDIRVGQTFKDKETLKKVIVSYAMSNNFQYKVTKSCTARYNLECLDDNCNWALKASRYRNTDIFIIRKLTGTHRCSLEVRHANSRQATSKIVAEHIKSKYTRTKTIYTPTDIMRDVQLEFGISISYMKAYRSREAALECIRGNPEESYTLLPSFLYMIQETNPGSIVNLKTTEDNTFLYAFMALKASIDGWQHCIPIIVVDGTFLKSKYQGTLLTAVTHDAQGKILILIFLRKSIF